MESKRISNGVLVFGVMAALLLMGIEVARHPGSIAGYGRRLLITDTAILLLNGIAGIWAWRQQHARFNLALSSGIWIALTAGAVLAANHIIEVFVPNRPFAVVIAPLLLMFTLLGTAGSIAWARTRSVLLAVISGVWCAMIAVIVLLCIVFFFNMAFERRAILGLHDAFIISATGDPGTFVVVNSLDAASEFLLRLPILGLFLSLTGALVIAWISRRTYTTVVLVRLALPVMCVTGVGMLWYADLLERAARPPFVMFGVLLVAIALCSAYPAWSARSALHRPER